MFSHLVLLLISGITAGITGERVNCRNSAKGSFDCVSPVAPSDLKAQNQYVLWLQSKPSEKSRNLDIQVPNYKIEDTIQAAAKGSFGKSHTSINLNLAKPELQYLAQKEERVGDVSHSYDVYFNYNQLKGHSVHFADEGAGSQRYSPLHQSIPEPSTSSSDDRFTTTIAANPTFNNTKTKTIPPVPCNNGFSSSFFTQVGYGPPPRPFNSTIDEETQELIDFVDYIRTVFSALGVITVVDNPIIGGRIVTVLDRGLKDIEVILADYLARSTFGRQKRQAADAINSVRGRANQATAAGDTSGLKPSTKETYSDAAASINKTRDRAG